jgi:hypothetical protein
MEPKNNKKSSTPQKSSGGYGKYGKRPLWQWILLYVIVGAIVYYIIYLLFFHGSGSGSTGGFSY